VYTFIYHFKAPKCNPLIIVFKPNKPIKNWVKWLEEQNRPKEPTSEEKFTQLCLDVAEELGQKYSMDSAESILTSESLHVYFTKGSKLYINIIPRSLLIRTCRVTPHIEKAIKLQLFRQKKREKNRITKAG
jgi:hypothetical protein